MKKTILAATLLAIATGASAAKLDQINTLAQGQFRLFSEDLGAALSYKALLPAEPLGLTGFDVGVEATSTSLANAAIFKAASGSDYSTLIIPKLHVDKGLPFGIDVGAFYATVPVNNVTLTGVEMRYAVLEGGVATPAVAVRGTWSRLAGVDQLDFSTKGVELTVSKGLAMVTPYAGVGNVWVDSKPQKEAEAAGLKSESFTESKVYAGLNFNTGLMNFAVEADKTGEATSYGIKVGFRW